VPLIKWQSIVKDTGWQDKNETPGYDIHAVRERFPAVIGLLIHVIFRSLIIPRLKKTGGKAIPPVVFPL